ncbi:MAG: penicillin-binding protein 2 [Candidatus Omnitrophica bacterium]|nr:penicillin-binding protein 2 [Candidatus Omnitrophota bacterium]
MSPASSAPERRLAHLRWLAGAAIVALGLALFRMQVWQGRTYRRLADANRIRLIPWEAPRGRLLDRQGAVLAAHRTVYDVAVIPQEVDDLTATLRALGRLLDRPESALRRSLQARRTYPFVPAVVAEDIGVHQAIRLEEQRSHYPGLIVRPRMVRSYPHGDLAAHVLGYIGPIDREELSRLRPYGYRLRDWVGKMGVERRYDGRLRGTPGGIMVEVDHQGRQVRTLGERPPQPGQDVQLTIDLEWQRQVEGLLGEQKGACVVIDPNTGEILAMASHPAFLPEDFVTGTPGARQRWLKDTASVLVNRSVSAAYTPGSIFKLVTATAALVRRAVSAADQVACPGFVRVGSQTYHCWNLDGHGPESLREALRDSCNVYFIHAGRQAGAEALADWAGRFGLGHPTGIELMEETTGHVPRPGRVTARRRGTWFEGETANLAIGQGALLMTPLQGAVMVSAMANGGRIIHPHVVVRVGTDAPQASSSRRLFVPSQILATVQEGMRRVVNDPQGTGYRAHLEGVVMAAKTGTAQTQIAGRPHGWFVGFLPADHPQIAFAILLEHGGSGGALPAEMAHQLALHWQSRSLGAAASTAIAQATAP